MKRRESIGLWVALGILLVVAALAYANATTLTQTEARVEHTHVVIVALGDLRGALAEAEAAKRGYSLTGGDAERSATNRATDQLGALLRSLRLMTADNPDQQRRLDALEILLSERTATLRADLARRGAGGFDLAREGQAVAEGDSQSARARAVVADMVGEERRLLVEREHLNSQRTRQVLLAQILGTCLGLILVLVTFSRLRGEVTRRIRSEHEARAVEEQLSATIQSIGDSIIATDAEGRVVRMNPSAEKLTGWPLPQAAGKPLAEVLRLVDESTGKPASNPVERVLKAGGTVGPTNHCVLVARNGTIRPVANSAAPIRNGVGHVTGVVMVFRDMSTQRAVAARVHEANAFLDSIVENLPDMVFVKDAEELRFVRFNRAGEELLGASRKDLIGKNDFDFFPAEQAEFFQAKDREVLAGRVVHDIAEEPIKTPRGQRWLHTKKIPILDEDSEKPLFLLGISEDITERKESADRLQRTHEELERRVQERTAELTKANGELEREMRERMQAEHALTQSEEQLRQSQKMEAIGRLAGGIAHDFNNLLSVIVSYASMLRQEAGEDSPMSADLEEIRTAGERAATLTRQLLAFSRQQVLAPKIVDLNAVIATMDSMLRRVIGEDIDLRAVTAPDLGMVKVDPGQIEQVIMNLVVNARDAMPDGGTLTIETANLDLDEGYVASHIGVQAGPHIMLAVTDTGVGMDEATQNRIFEPFFTTKGVGKGTGLGLSTVFGIVKQSGGSVWPYSELGKGTTFKIYLPRTFAAGSSATMRAVAPEAKTGSETVLLVEDAEQVRTLASNILKRAGYDVIEANGPIEALRLCETIERKIDLLLTDVVMPQMSGRQLSERVVTLRPTTKVLYMSGYTDDAIVRHGVLDAGVAFLQKPLTPEALCRKVREALDG